MALLLIILYIEYIKSCPKGRVPNLAAHLVPDDSPLATDLLDEEALVVEDIRPHWELVFDGAPQRAPGEGKGWICLSFCCLCFFEQKYLVHLVAIPKLSFGFYGDPMYVLGITMVSSSASSNKNKLLLCIV